MAIFCGELPVFSGLLVDRPAVRVTVPLLLKTTRSYFPFNEAGYSPLFTGEMLRNNYFAGSHLPFDNHPFSLLHCAINNWVVTSGHRSLSCRVRFPELVSKCHS
jgi:hypothetical protein